MKALLDRALHSASLMLAYAVGGRILFFGATLPLTLALLSTAENALWQMFLTIQSMQLMADLGLTVSLSRYFSYGYAGATSLAEIRVDPKQAQRAPNWPLLIGLYRGAGRIYLVLVTAWVVLLATGGSYLVARLVADTHHPASAWLAWCAVVVGSAGRLLTNRDLALLYGVQRIALVRGIEGHIWIASTAIALALLAGGAGLLPVVLAMQALLVANTLVNRRLSAAVFATGAPGMAADDDVRVLQTVWPSVWRSGLAMLLYFAATRVAALSYARIGTVEMTAGLLLAQNIMALLVNFTSSPFYSRLPAIATAWATHDLEHCRQLAARAFAMSGWALAGAIVAVGALGPSLMHAIGSNIAFVPSLLWALIGLAFMLERHGIMHLQLYAQTNQVIWHRVQGITGVVFVALFVGLVPYLGAYAIPLAQALSCVGYQSWAAARPSYAAFGLTFWGFDAATVCTPLTLVVAWLLFAMIY